MLALIAQASNGSSNPIALFAPLILMGGVFYFLLIRPQQKQKSERAAMLAAVKSCDRVVMSSGLHGTVVKLSEHGVTLKVADQVRLEFDRAAIGRIVPASGEGGASS